MDIDPIHAAGDVAVHEAGYTFPAPGLRRLWQVAESPSAISVDGAGTKVLDCAGPGAGERHR
ncbi:MAG: hypothetical protein ACYDAQ_05375, partial [Mycobacteriales bacterium]